MHHHFGVAGGLEDGTAVLEFAAPLGGVSQIAVVAKRDFALVAINHDGLGVEQSLVAGRGIARMAYGEASRQLGEYARLKNFLDFAHGAMEKEIGTVTRNDAGGFLASMLERVEAEIGEVRGFRMAEDAEHTTLVVEMIV